MSLATSTRFTVFSNPLPDMPQLPVLILQNADDAQYFSSRYEQKNFKRWIAYDALAQQTLRNKGIEFTDESFYLSGQIAELKKIQNAAHRMACEWYLGLPPEMFPGKSPLSRPESLSVRAFNYYFQSSLCAYFFLKRIREVEGPCELWITKIANASQRTLLRDSARPLPDLLANLNDSLWNFQLKWQPEPPYLSHAASAEGEENPGAWAGALLSVLRRFRKMDVLFSGNPSLLAPVARQLSAPSSFLRQLRTLRDIALIFRANTVLFSVQKTKRKGQDWNAIRERLEKSGVFSFDGVDFFETFREKISDFYQNQAAGVEDRYDSLLDFLKKTAPRCVVVDEDVTESHRALIAAARRLNIKTLVIAHGLPGAPWGFMPLAADHIALWGDYSTAAFKEWGLRDERMLLTGCPKYDSLRPVESASRELKIKIASQRGWNPENPLVLIIPGKFRTDPFDRFDGSGSTSTETLKTAHIFLETARKLPQVNFIFKFRADALENRIFKELLGHGGAAPENIDFTHQGLALDYLAASDLVFNNCSSACLESVLLKRPVAAMNYAYYPNVFPFYETGLGAVVRNGEETYEVCKKLSEGKLPLRSWIESQEKLVKPFLFARDGGAASRVAAFIAARLSGEAFLDSRAETPEPQPVRS